jgi:Mrp family chromosome partitioning ATPase/capsular polysaccharide biosynthesis protein
VAARREDQDGTLRDYVRVVWRRKWVIIGLAIVLMALAGAYSYVKTPLYKASAQLTYESQLNVADPLSSGGYVDPTKIQVELDSVSSVITSPQVVDIAQAAIDQDPSAADYTVSAASDTLPGQTYSNTVSITAVSPSAQTAKSAAQAYAEAFTEFRRSSEQAVVRQAEEVLQAKLNAYKTEAERSSADYLTLLQRVQDLQILEATATGNFKILVPAGVPSAPYTPQKGRNVAMALVAGLILGVGLALLLDQFDTRVRSPEQVAAIFGWPVLGQLRKCSAKALEQQPLYVLSDSLSPAAEAIRKLRGNLEFANIDGDLKSIFVTSCLQHEGKSLTVCNLALAMAASGNRVVLVDGDLRRPQVHRYLNLPNATGLSSVLTGKTGLSEALRFSRVGRVFTRGEESGGGDAPSNRDYGLHVLTSGPLPPSAAEMIASKSFANLIARLEAEFDMVIVDAPALLAVGDTAAIARSVDGLIFLTDVTRAKRPLLLEAAAQMSQMPSRKLGLVILLQASSRRQERDGYSYYAEATSPLEVGARGRERSSQVRT